MKRADTSFAVLLSWVAASLVAGCATQSIPGPKLAPPSPASTTVSTQRWPATPWTGAPAITPPANSPITDAQVRSYVLSHRVPFTVQSTNVAVVSTSFLSNRQMGALLQNMRIGVPDEEPMCVVVMSGNFVFQGPPGAKPAYPIGIEVFDARTGNLLATAGRPSPPRPATQ